jgi:hypothetical protein
MMVVFDSGCTCMMGLCLLGGCTCDGWCSQCMLGPYLLGLVFV